MDFFFRKFGSKGKARDREGAGGRQVKEGLLVCLYFFKLRYTKAFMYKFMIMKFKI